MQSNQTNYSNRQRINIFSFLDEENWTPVCTITFDITKDPSHTCKVSIQNLKQNVKYQWKPKKLEKFKIQMNVSPVGMWMLRWTLVDIWYSRPNQFLRAGPAREISTLPKKLRTPKYKNKKMFTIHKKKDYLF